MANSGNTEVSDIVKCFPVQKIGLINTIEQYIHSCTGLGLRTEKIDGEQMEIVTFKFKDAHQPKLNHVITFAFNRDFFFSEIQPLIGKTIS